MKNLRSRLIFAAIILVVLLNTLMAFYAVNTLVDNQDLQSHTLKVMAQTQGLIAQVRAAESAARGFVLTGDPKFETFYRSSSVSSNQMMDALNTLTHDNVSQQKRIALLRQRVAVKFGALDFGIAARRTQARGEPPMSELGPMLRDTPDNGVSVQYVISQIEGEERRLLAERDRTTLQSEHEAWIALGLASTLDLLFILTAFRLLASAHRSRDELAQQTERIAHLNSELSVANADLESRVLLRTQELEVSNRELEAFSYSVSHDLRAPLRTIDGFSLALEEDFADKLDDDGRDYIRRVRNGVQRMGSLIDALLQLSRVSRSDLQREPVNLSQLATLVFHELQAADPERTTQWAAAPDVVVDADPRLLRIALENLIGNAWKFTSKTANAQIEFGTGIEEGRTVYFIRDNGAGFDMQYVDRLFGAFQRLHGDRDFKGSGIGLATVSRIIRRHHGTIRAEGRIDHGATFYFTLEG